MFSLLSMGQSLHATRMDSTIRALPSTLPLYLSSNLPSSVPSWATSRTILVGTEFSVGRLCWLSFAISRCTPRLQLSFSQRLAFEGSQWMFSFYMTLYTSSKAKGTAIMWSKMFFHLSCVTSNMIVRLKLLVVSIPTCANFPKARTQGLCCVI